MTDDSELSVTELLELDETEAREMLTVEEFEQWEQLQDLETRAEETEDEWEREEETVAAVTVSADMDDLGTRVELYGNDLLVYADPEDPDFRAAAERLDEFEDISGEDIADDDLDAEETDAYADALLDLLDCVLVEWDGTDWRDLSADEREATLAEVRSAWGLAGLTQGWAEIAVAIREDREEVVGQLESFRRPERRGNR